METQPEVLSFVKALTSAERLRIVGILSQGSKRAVEIASALGVHPSDVMRHLEQLTATSVVHEADGVYELNVRSIETLARGQLESKHHVFETDNNDDDIRKILKNYFKADGMLKRIPPMGNKRRVILNFIVGSFAFDTNYSEMEVNTILRRFHLDTAALRRYLVDHGLMSRESDGTKYWRVKDTEL